MSKPRRAGRRARPGAAWDERLTAPPSDVAELIQGSKAAWDLFVQRYAGLIMAAVKRAVGTDGEIDDIVQDVFVRLCKDDYRLLKQYDPSRAGLTTWLTIVARSAARDAVRRRKLPMQTIDATPESAFAVQPKPFEPLRIPDGLLSPRQSLILTLLYQRDMEVAEVAEFLGIDPQTVRSTHHKAMLKLRAHFSDLA
jgi:RNA polymerase sigma-70 factor (ECF subfamily)